MTHHPRNALKSIAAGVLGSFVSRNNDFNGYWAIGQLYSLALKSRGKTVSISLTGDSGVPRGTLPGALEFKYGEMFFNLLARWAIQKDCIKTATIILEFECDMPSSQVLANNGKPFRATFAVETDYGQCFQLQYSGACWSHNPARESRSTRGR